MRYELMLPYQIRSAIERSVPAVVPLGVLEYHGEHMAVGMDTLAVTRILERLEKEIEIVILPAFTYGAASFAVAAPEGTGTVHIDASVLASFAEELFTSLLRIGFRNVYGIIHHQTENFRAGMPTDLAFRLGARQAIFRFLENSRGEGWWGQSEMSEYYADQATRDDPFNWISIHPLMDEKIIQTYPFDHAGIGETSLMLALAPEVVERRRNADNEAWYTRSAAEASSAFGERGVSAILDRFRTIFGCGHNVDALK